VRAEPDENKYPRGGKVSDAESAAVNLFTPRLPWRLELHDFTSSQSPGVFYGQALWHRRATFRHLSNHAATIVFRRVETAESLLFDQRSLPAGDFKNTD
jgi:hypothetical protein